MHYVLVTGASSGIGEAYARQLAAQQQALILVARRQQRLETLASELSASHDVKIQVVAADLATDEGVKHLVDTVSQQGWTLNGLINNAGFGDSGLFNELSLDRQLAMIQVNVTSLVSLTHQLLHNLKQTQQSFIINVASVGAFQASPRMAIYCATKAFVLSFSEALHEELKGRVRVSAVCPGATRTEFAAEAHVADSLMFKVGTSSPEQVVKKSLAERHRAIVIPGAQNLLTTWISKLSPRTITRQIAHRLQM